MQVPATIISLGLKLDGDIASFGPEQQGDLRSSLKTSLGCEEPACFLSLRAQPGSIDVETILTIPQQAALAAMAFCRPCSSGCRTSVALRHTKRIPVPTLGEKTDKPREL